MNIYVAYHKDGQATIEAHSFSEAWEIARQLYSEVYQVVLHMLGQCVSSWYRAGQ